MEFSGGKGRSFTLNSSKGAKWKPDGEGLEGRLEVSGRTESSQQPRSRPPNAQLRPEKKLDKLKKEKNLDLKL